MDHVLRLLPRFALLASAVLQWADGDIAYAGFCLAALAITLAPAIQARRLDSGIPLALELALLWVLVADVTLGNTLGFYRLHWYDKALHLSSSVLLGIAAVLAVAAMQPAQDLQARRWLHGLVVVLVTLGLGALWELGEYGVDALLGRHTQGSPRMMPLEDTMLDLLLDGIGGAIGAVIGHHRAQCASSLAARKRRTCSSADARSSAGVPIATMRPS